MTLSVGIGLAFVAMLSWGIGDFLIQRGTRKIGNWETLFVICAFGSLILLPFVWQDIASVVLNPLNKSFLVLLAGSMVLLVAALLDFEALKKGKLSVVEPIWSFEIPAASILAYVVLGERIDSLQLIVIVLLIVSLILVSFKEKNSLKKFFLEKGVFIAFFAAFVMGSANFFYGWGARVTDPLMVNFFVNVFVTLVTGMYLVFYGKFGKTLRDIVLYQKILLPMAILDNTAWIAFAFSMSLSPIAVATALSESYIVVAVLLGLVVNKERLQRHQKFGLVGAIASAIVLAILST